MSTLPIEPYLIELLERMERDEMSPIIAGGLGIFLKYRWVRTQLEFGHRILFDNAPDARATEDIDAFFRLEVYVQPARAELRRALAELGYVSRTDYLIFEKALADGSGRKISLDLLAPISDDPRFKVDKPTKPGKLHRFGPIDNSTSPPDERLHAFATPEAFAIAERPQNLPLDGQTPAGAPYRGQVRVPHPFASLCMKIKAAADFERAPALQRKPRAEKHAQDVYLLLAILSEDEWNECNELRNHFHDHPELLSISDAVTDLFAAPDGRGCMTVARNTPNADLQRMCDVLCELFPRPNG